MGNYEMSWTENQAELMIPGIQHTSVWSKRFIVITIVWNGLSAFWRCTTILCHILSYWSWEGSTSIMLIPGRGLNRNTVKTCLFASPDRKLFGISYERIPLFLSSNRWWSHTVLNHVTNFCQFLWACSSIDLDEVG